MGKMKQENPDVMMHIDPDMMSHIEELKNTADGFNIGDPVKADAHMIRYCIPTKKKI